MGDLLTVYGEAVGNANNDCTGPLIIVSIENQPGDVLRRPSSFMAPSQALLWSCDVDGVGPWLVTCFSADVQIRALRKQQQCL